MNKETQEQKTIILKVIAPLIIFAAVLAVILKVLLLVWNWPMFLSLTLIASCFCWFSDNERLNITSNWSKKAKDNLKDTLEAIGIVLSLIGFAALLYVTYTLVSLPGEVRCYCSCH